MKISIKFPITPPVGTCFSIDTQEYEFSGSEPYTRSDGVKSELLVWETCCAECGRDFQIKTPLGFTTGQSRRCPEHRSPGKPVADRTRNFARRGKRA